MFKKILSFLLISLFGLTLTSCSNYYSIKEYKNNVSYSAFSGWKSEFEMMSSNKSYEYTYDGEIHKKSTSYLKEKEMENYQYDAILDESAKFDLVNKLAVTKSNMNEKTKKITRYGKEESKCNVDKDYSYQIHEKLLCELDDNNKVYSKVILQSFESLVEYYLDIPNIVQYLTECDTYYVDNNVYTAVLENNSKKIVCQIIVNDNSLTLVSQYNATFEENFSNDVVVKEEINYKHSYRFTFKDIELKPKDISKYTLKK